MKFPCVHILYKQILLYCQFENIIFEDDLFQDQTERNRLSLYWKHLSAIIFGSICLFVFDMCERYKLFKILQSTCSPLHVLLLVLTICIYIFYRYSPTLKYFCNYSNVTYMHMLKNKYLHFPVSVITLPTNFLTCMSIHFIDDNF